MDFSNSKRILILEDEILIAMELEDYVEDYGCAVVGPVASCASALELLTSDVIHAAILDLVIRDEHCDVVIDELTKRGIPWAIATGMDARQLGPRYRAAPFLAKPYDQNQVCQVLDKMLSGTALEAG